MGSVARQFEDFRKSDFDLATRWPQVMHRLEYDDRMGSAWDSFTRNSTDPTVFRDLLSNILRLKHVVGQYERHAAMLEKAAADKERVVSAIAVIATFLLSVRDADKESIYRLQKDFEQKQTQAGELLQDVGRMMKFAGTAIGRSEKRLSLIVPSSRKSGEGAEHVHFSNLLCSLLHRKIGQPLYTFVATTTLVLYDLEDYSSQAARMNYERDLKRRGVVKPAIRTVRTIN